MIYIFDVIDVYKDKRIYSGTSIKDVCELVNITPKWAYKASKDGTLYHKKYMVYKERLFETSKQPKPKTVDQLDTGMIDALHKADWSVSRIAKEMDTDEATIKMVLKLS